MVREPKINSFSHAKLFLASNIAGIALFFGGGTGCRKDTVPDMIEIGGVWYYEITGSGSMPGQTVTVSYSTVGICSDTKTV